MHFTTKISRLISVLSVLLLFVFLCSSAASSLRVSQAKNHSAVALRVQDGDKQERHEHEEHEEDGEDHVGDEHEDGEDGEQEIEEMMFEMEIHAREIELEAKLAETEVMQIELMSQIFEVVQDADKTSFFAIMKIDDLMDEEEAVEMLDQCLQEAKSDSTKRAIRMKLVELQSEMDDQEAAREHLRTLILGE